MYLQYLYWTLSGAAGILLFIFLNLLFWDLYRFLPTPFDDTKTPDPYALANFKAGLKKWMFYIGVGFTIFLIVMVQDPRALGFTWFPYYNPDSNMIWVLLFGCAAPTVALFLARVAITVSFLIYLTYLRSELLYEKSKAWFVKQLKKRGHIE